MAENEKQADKDEEDWDDEYVTDEDEMSPGPAWYACLVLSILIVMLATMHHFRGPTIIEARVGVPINLAEVAGMPFPSLEMGQSVSMEGEHMYGEFNLRTTAFVGGTPGTVKLCLTESPGSAGDGGLIDRLIRGWRRPPCYQIIVK